MTIYYFDALAGAGKTRALARHAHKLAGLDWKVFFIQPSKRLIKQTIREELKPLDPDYPITPIHGDETDAVVQALVRHFKEVKPGGEIVFATHAALLRLPYLHDAKAWVLIMDEVLPVDVFKELRVPETHRLITDLVEFEPTGAAYGLLRVRGGE